MSGAKSVAKGKRYERAVARELRALFKNAQRCLQYQRKHGAPDVAAGPLFVEVKSYPVATARVYREAEARAKNGFLPAVVQPAGKRGPLLITLSLADFIALAKGESCPF